MLEITGAGLHEHALHGATPVCPTVATAVAVLKIHAKLTAFAQTQHVEVQRRKSEGCYQADSVPSSPRTSQRAAYLRIYALHRHVVKIRILPQTWPLRQLTVHGDGGACDARVLTSRVQGAGQRVWASAFEKIHRAWSAMIQHMSKRRQHRSLMISGGLGGSNTMRLRVCGAEQHQVLWRAHHPGRPSRGRCRRVVRKSMCYTRASPPRPGSSRRPSPLWPPAPGPSRS